MLRKCQAKYVFLGLINLIYGKYYLYFLSCFVVYDQAVKNLFFVAEIRSCFSFVFPKKIVFNEEGLLVELRSLPPGFEVGQVASLFANLEKSSKFKVVVGVLPKDAIALSFVGATLKDGLKVCQNLDSLFSRGRTK